MFGGRPIIHYSIESAKRAGVFDKVIVSTDSEEIAEVAECHSKTSGGEFMGGGESVSSLSEQIYYVFNAQTTFEQNKILNKNQWKI